MVLGLVWVVAGGWVKSKIKSGWTVGKVLVSAAVGAEAMVR